MSGLLAALPTLFAQANAPAGAGAGANPGYSQYIIYGYIGIAVFWFYWILIRPQREQERRLKSMLAGMKKNDRVLTASGIYGTVVAIDEGSDRVVLRIDDDRGVKVAFTRASIARVFDPQDKEKEKATESA